MTFRSSRRSSKPAWEIPEHLVVGLPTTHEAVPTEEVPIGCIVALVSVLFVVIWGVLGVLIWQHLILWSIVLGVVALLSSGLALLLASEENDVRIGPVVFAAGCLLVAGGATWFHNLWLLIPCVLLCVFFIVVAAAVE